MATMLKPDTTPIAGTLSERAMNVTLSLSAYGGKRLDRKVTQEVLAERKAESDAGKFEKNLVPPKSLEGVTKAHTTARARHYLLTLPWGEEGVRILSATAFMDYSQAMMQERNKCEAEYEKFIVAYPDLLASAPRRLGRELFKASDFPRPSEIRHKFGFRLHIMPVPDSDDFRVQIGAEAERQIRASIEETVKERYSEAQRDIYSRLLDAVGHFAQTMQESGKVFRDTTFTKLGDIARIAPKLSLTQDPKLEELCAKVLSITDGIGAQDLRDNVLLRTSTARKAQATLAQIESAMQGAF